MMMMVVIIIKKDDDNTTIAFFFFLNKTNIFRYLPLEYSIHVQAVITGLLHKEVSMRILYL